MGQTRTQYLVSAGNTRLLLPAAMEGNVFTPVCLFTGMRGIKLSCKEIPGTETPPPLGWSPPHRNPLWRKIPQTETSCTETPLDRPPFTKTPSLEGDPLCRETLWMETRRRRNMGPDRKCHHTSLSYWHLVAGR